MNSLPEKVTELRDLLAHLCNDDLSIPGFERLIELLSDDPDAQKFYICYTDMNESMRDMAVTLDHQELLAELQAKLTDLRALSEIELFDEAAHSRDAGPSTEVSRFELQTTGVSGNASLQPSRLWQ